MNHEADDASNSSALIWEKVSSGDEKIPRLTSGDGDEEEGDPSGKSSEGVSGSSVISSPDEMEKKIEKKPKRTRKKSTRKNASKTAQARSIMWCVFLASLPTSCVLRPSVSRNLLLYLILGVKSISRAKLRASRGTRPTSQRTPSTGPPRRRERRMRTSQSQAPRDYLGPPVTARTERRTRATTPPKVATKRGRKRRRRRANSTRGDRGAGRGRRTGMRGRGVLRGIAGGEKIRTATMTATTASRAPPSGIERPSSRLTDTF